MSVESSIVLDLGCSTVKAGYVFGFPSDDEPRVITPAAVRMLPDGGAAGGGANGAAPPSTDAHAPAAAGAAGGELRYAVRQGVVQDWDALETVLHHVFYTELGWVVGEEGNLLVADPVATSRPDRERLTALVFETFNATAFFVADQAVLSLYSIGKLNGTVLDIGASTICIAPVMEGLSQLSTMRRLPYGGQDLTHLLGTLMAQRGAALPPGKEGEAVAEAIKLRLLRPAEPAAGAAGGGGAPPGGGDEVPEGPVTHTLPDGQTITVEPQREGEALLQALLDPSRLGLELPPLAEVVVTAAAAQPDKDTRKVLIENIFPCGGGSAARGLARRLLAEARTVAPPPLQPGLCGVPEYMPDHTARVAAWMGGALLAKVVFGQAQQQISKAEYDEYGPFVVHRKCS